MKKASLILAVVIILTLFVIAPASAVVDKSEEFYVADYSGVLKDATKQDIINANAALEYYTGGQIVVVTVEYLDGLYSDEYAVRLMNDWGVGDATKNNGMLLLLATEENKAWLTQGAGIDKVFDSGTINSLLDDYFWNKFDKRDFDGAVNSLFPYLLGWYEQYYNIDLESGEQKNPGNTYNPGNNYYPADEPYSYSFYSLFGTIRSIIIIAVIVIVLVSYMSVSSRGRRRYYRGSSYPFWPFFFMGNNRHFHNHNNNHNQNNNRNNRGGGGFGGGGFGGGFGGGRGGGGFGGGGFGGGGHSGGGGGGRR